ncbi:uncharacterized protein LOC111479047 isoform X2 [Cucurbita maxima]|uniref:Protein ARV n=1 Tax=Cucurbita maxima TaxID=3661 RepID=A0A6J1INC3_CUCMA|nr:uncharacterized protein LOC111479047 isoform X2 [Cucurbita maxima]XP_022979277.1 uncharacterized protein LOC111479047 isoform X2 [Cucurbita maxima]
MLVSNSVGESPPLGCLVLLVLYYLHHTYFFILYIVSYFFILYIVYLSRNQLDRYMLLRLSEKQSYMTFSSTIGICQKILMDICVGNIMFICALHILSRVFLRSSAGVHKYRYKHFFFAIIISSYFKIFLVCMMIWEFPSPVIFIIDLFVLSSNVIAIKVITESAVSRCVGTCLCAHGAKFLATKLFEK